MPIASAPAGCRRFNSFRCPELPVLISSGNADLSTAADLPSHSGADPLLTEPALKKPFLSAFETGSRSDHCGLLASAKAGE